MSVVSTNKVRKLNCHQRRFAVSRESGMGLLYHVAYLRKRWPALSDEHLRAILAQIQIFVGSQGEN